MPYTSQKKGKCWEVVNTDTGKVFAKCTTEEKAKAQLRLLRGVESGKWKPSSSYRDFVRQEFKKRPPGTSAPDWMKEISVKWKQMKMKGGGY